MKIKILILIISLISISAITSGSPADSEAGANNGGNIAHNSNNGKSEKEIPINIKDVLNINIINDSFEFNKGEPIILKIRCACSDNSYRIESLLVLVELPPEINLIATDPKVTNISNNIIWNIKDMYNYLIQLQFVITGSKSGDLHIPLTINAKIKLKNGERVEGDIPIDPISIRVFNHEPELVQINHQNTFLGKSVRIIPRDLDNDSLECKIYGDDINFSFLNVIPKANNTYDEIGWDLPYHYWGTYKYTIIADDGDDNDYSRKVEYPSKREFEIVYGLSNLAVLASFSLTIILIFFSYKRYKLKENETKKDDLKEEMDEVISPLYKIFNKNKNINAYLSQSIESKLSNGYPDCFKKIEMEIKDIFDKESIMQPELLHLIRQYQDHYSNKDYGKAEFFLDGIYKYVFDRHEFILKNKLLKK